MSKFVIHGGNKLKGDVIISGAKNAALKQIAAAILTSKPCVLNNVPRISDVDTMINIIENLGAKTKWLEKHKLWIDCATVNSYKPDKDLVNKIRGSVVLAGPLLARFGKAEIAKPGGDIIGVRPVYIHWKAFQKFGVKVNETSKIVKLSIDKILGKKVVLDEMSVTATENVIMLAVLANGITEIRIAAAEPEIQDLALFLNKMGANITGAGTHNIKIKGVKKLHGTNHTVLPDRIEIGTFAVAAAITGGKVVIRNIIPNHIEMFLNKLNATGVNYKIINIKNKFADLLIDGFKEKHPVKIDTRTYPGFPTDLQAPTSVLLTQLPKTSKIFETLYDNRLKYLFELQKMGAKINVIDEHIATISGPTKLHGAKITAFDIRAGATLILAGLIAKGTTEINHIETIDRGYENIEGKLRKLGADIKRM
jgi:UDP-N-acetylglucosamine 1-carboxyvinyltransferase